MIFRRNRGRKRLGRKRLRRQRLSKLGEEGMDIWIELRMDRNRVVIMDRNRVVIMDRNRVVIMDRRKHWVIIKWMQIVNRQLEWFSRMMIMNSSITFMNSLRNWINRIHRPINNWLKVLFITRKVETVEAIVELWKTVVARKISIQWETQTLIEKKNQPIF